MIVWGSAVQMKGLGLWLVCFRSGREFAAWLGLTPLQRSTGGKKRLGRISCKGDQYIRRLLIGASNRVRHGQRRPRRMVSIRAEAPADRLTAGPDLVGDLALAQFFRRGLPKAFRSLSGIPARISLHDRKLEVVVGADPKILVSLLKGSGGIAKYGVTGPGCRRNPAAERIALDPA